MIYINRSADYSANNIGSVVIPTDLDETASAILAKYTKTLSNAKKQAFSNLISGMKSAGIYAKVDYLLLPCLAGSVSEAFYEVKHDTTKDMTDASTYGQYSLDSNGLTSAYDSEHTYTPAYISMNRSTFAHTVATVIHSTSSASNFVWWMNQTSGCLRGTQTTRAYFTVASSGNTANTATFASQIGTCSHILQSITAESSTWTPSSANNIVRCNGEAATSYGANIESSIANLKTSNFYPAGYQSYGSSFCMKNGSLDLAAICQNLEGVACTDDANTTMAVRLSNLLATFKTAFFA